MKYTSQEICSCLVQDVLPRKRTKWTQLHKYLPITVLRNEQPWKRKTRRKMLQKQTQTFLPPGISVPTYCFPFFPVHQANSEEQGFTRCYMYKDTASIHGCWCVTAPQEQCQGAGMEWKGPSLTVTPLEWQWMAMQSALIWTMLCLPKKAADSLSLTHNGSCLRPNILLIKVWH